MCLKPEPLAGVYSHGDGMVDISKCAKAIPINGRGSVVLPIPRENVAIDEEFKMFYHESHFSDLIESDRITSRNQLI